MRGKSLMNSMRTSKDRRSLTNRNSYNGGYWMGASKKETLATIEGRDKRSKTMKTEGNISPMIKSNGFSFGMHSPEKTRNTKAFFFNSGPERYSRNTLHI